MFGSVGPVFECIVNGSCRPCQDSVCLLYFLLNVILSYYSFCTFSPVFCPSPLFSKSKYCLLYPSAATVVLFSVPLFNLSLSPVSSQCPPPHTHTYTIYGLPSCLVSQVFPIVSRYPSVSVLFKPQCFSFWLLVRSVRNRDRRAMRRLRENVKMAGSTNEGRSRA